MSRVAGASVFIMVCRRGVRPEGDHEDFPLLRREVERRGGEPETSWMLFPCPSWKR
jgi:hypothetical protein